MSAATMLARLRPAWLGALLCAAAVPLAAAEMGGLQDYFANTLIWQNQVTGALGRLWLNPDGHYFAFYNLGPQPRPPDSHGPFQVEGRFGTFTLRNDGDATQLCLSPASPRIELGAQSQHELYSEGMCYGFVPHALGEHWSEAADPLARSYRFWLVKGR